MKRGKPTRRGMGSPSDAIGSETPASGGLPRTTHLGLGDSQPPKLVTMHGVAPPSDRPPPADRALPADRRLPADNPLSAKRPQCTAPDSGPQTIEYTAEDLDLRHDALPQFEPHELPAHLAEELAKDGDAYRGAGPGTYPHLDRSQFRTAPGGGKNRISGGRPSAAAYVSPSTLSPGHGADPGLGPVEVADHVLREARSFQTEPSLAKKRASQLPPASETPVPPPPTISYDRKTLVWTAVGICLVLGGLIWSLGSGRATPAQPDPLAKSQQGSPADADIVKPAAVPSTAVKSASTEERALLDPTPEVELPAEAGPVQTASPPVQSASLSAQAVAPLSSPEKSNATSTQERNARPPGPTKQHGTSSPPKPASSRSADSAKDRDLWLE